MSDDAKALLLTVAVALICAALLFADDVLR